MLLGVDLGTTAVKATAFRPAAGVVGRAGAQTTTIRGQPGEYEQDPETWWSAHHPGRPRQQLAGTRSP